jgi:hypothetical protein
MQELDEIDEQMLLVVWVSQHKTPELALHIARHLVE